MRRWWVLAIWGCTTSPGGAGVDAAQDPLDGGLPADARSTDAAPPDGSPRDAGLDGAHPDAMARDAAAPDAAAGDAHPGDAHVRDAAPRDAAPRDAEADATPPDAAPPREACFNQADDDGDGRVDCADPDCRRSGACFDHAEDCANGLDDNGDDHTDCDDVRCLSVCPPSAAGPLQVAEIQAIFDTECNACHGAARLALLDLRAPFTADTVNVRSSEVQGLRIVPGRRQDSYLYRKLAFTFREVNGGGGEGMPPLPAAPLPAETVDRIGQWIDALEP